MNSFKLVTLIYTTLTLCLKVFGQSQMTPSSDNSQEHLLKQLFANNAPVLEPTETLKLLKTLNSSLVVSNNENSKTTIVLANDLNNLIEANEITSEKCKSDLFVDYLTLMRHLDPKTYRLMYVFDNYNGAAWNENIFKYLIYYHNEQYKLCVNLFKEATKEVSSQDLETIETLAKGVRNGSEEIPFPLIVPEDIERAVLNIIKPNIKELVDKDSILNTQGLYLFSDEFDKIKKVCSRFQESISDHVQFAQQAYFSYLRQKVVDEKLLIKYAFYSDICELIDAVSDVQKMEFLQTLTKSLDR